jgi:hypothetical protein
LAGTYGMLARTHAFAGRTEEAHRFIAEMENGPMHSGRADALAHTYAILGNWEKTIEWLEWEPPFFGQPATLILPSLDPFRNEPRFQARLKSYNLALEPGWTAPVPLPPEREGLPEVDFEPGAGGE